MSEERKRSRRGELVPRSTEELILRYSTARVIAASPKIWLVSFDIISGTPRLSRKMDDADALIAMIKRYA